MKIFLANDPTDEKLVNKIIAPLEVATRSRLELEFWGLRNILPGQEVNIEIERNLHSAELVLFFLSADFLASDFFNQIVFEVQRRVEKGVQKAIPIILRPCLWSYAPFLSKLASLPKNGDPVTSHQNTDQIIYEISEDILNVIEYLEIKEGGGDGVSTGFKIPAETIVPNFNNKFETEKELIDELKKLLAENRIKEVFDVLDEVLESSNSDLENTVILLKSRYSRALSDQRMGIVTSENYNIERGKILYALLQLIEEIPKDVKSRGIENTNIFLDETKNTSGFEVEQKGYEELRKYIYDTDNDIDQILNNFDGLDIESYPSINLTLQGIKKDYESILKHEFSSTTKDKLNKVRENLLNLLGDFEQKRGELQKNKASIEKDISSSDTVFWNEMKLILIGNGGVGKTTIRQNLVIPGYKTQSHSSTEGLEVVTWEYPTTSIPNIEKIKFNIWDFGGQGKYRAVQRFFCSSRALYIYVTTPFEETSDQNDDYTGIDYWLNFVKLFGQDTENGQSPIIFVMNKCDLPAGNQNIDKDLIQAKFGNIQDFIRISCASETGFEELKKTIERRLVSTNIIKPDFPRAWLLVKNELQRLSKVEDYISFENYLGIFANHVPFNSSDHAQIEQIKSNLSLFKNNEDIILYLGKFHAKVFYSSIIEYWELNMHKTDWAKLVAERLRLEEKADALIRHIHDAGIILYYPRVSILSNKVILNPNWARELAYKVLDSPYAATGVLRSEDLTKIFTDERHKYAIDLLLSYRICYEHKINFKTTYFFPSLFPNKAPLGWLNLGAIGTNVMQYECEFNPIIPADFMSRFIAKEYKILDNPDQFWKYGALVSKNENTKTYAQIEEDWRKNRLIVNAIGDDWDELICIIANQINELREEINIDETNMAEITIQEKLIDLKSKTTINISQIRKDNEIIFAKDIKGEGYTNGFLIETPMLKTDVFLPNKQARAMLYLSACPKELRSTRFNDEYSSIERSCTSNNIEVKAKLQVESYELFQVINSYKASYIHISVHGKRDGGLIFVDEKLQEKEVDEEEVIDVFQEIISKNKIDLVCFSACHSKKYAEKLASVIKYTIGMDGAFPIEAAVLFAKIFYHNFFYGSSVEFAFKQTLRNIKKMKLAAQDEIEVHLMPKLFVDNQLISIIP